MIHVGEKLGGEKREREIKDDRRKTIRVIMTNKKKLKKNQRGGAMRGWREIMERKKKNKKIRVRREDETLRNEGGEG